MPFPQRELFSYLRAQPREAFSVDGRIDARRHLARTFPKPLPLLLSYQSYPTFRQMVGDNWMHWHDYYELWVATEGAGEYRSGNHQFTFSPGDIVLVDPLKLHGVLRMERAHRPLVIFFRTEAIAPAGSEVDLAFLSAYDLRPESLSPVVRFESNAASPILAAIDHLAHAWFESRTKDRFVTLKFHLLEVLLRLRDAFPANEAISREPAPARAEREAKLGRVLEYVSHHFHTPLSQPEVSRVAGMSPSRFRIFFKETTGWGFADYLRDFRLERSAELLRDSTESVASVAYRTGFADQSHLQRLFKAKYDISPLAYRKRCLRETGVLRMPLVERF
jgi:AraC-like DNA-binding protein/mannose-6-phosphate isomerase-like protein (cupin superfamily)